MDSCDMASLFAPWGSKFSRLIIRGSKPRHILAADGRSSSYYIALDHGANAHESPLQQRGKWFGWPSPFYTDTWALLRSNITRPLGPRDPL